MSADTLRKRIEARIRRHHMEHDGWVRVEDAADEAEAMIREEQARCADQHSTVAIKNAISGFVAAAIHEERERWGHVAGCGCHEFNGESGCEEAGYLACNGPCQSGDTHPFHDPRCADEDESDAD